VWGVPVSGQSEAHALLHVLGATARRSYANPSIRGADFMQTLARWAAATTLAACCTAAALAQVAATPAGWEPEQAIAKADVWIHEQVAVYERREPAADIKLALRRALMLAPDEPTATNQLAFYYGPGQPDAVYLDILAFRPD
jgi:hypothetical protein